MTMTGPEYRLSVVSREFVFPARPEPPLHKTLMRLQKMCECRSAELRSPRQENLFADDRWNSLVPGHDRGASSMTATGVGSPAESWRAALAPAERLRIRQSISPRLETRPVGRSIDLVRSAPIRLTQTPTTYRGGHASHLAPAMRPLRPVLAFEALPESGRLANHALSATIEDGGRSPT
jgi:hypothetical protein